MNFDHLTAKSPAELVTLAAQTGVKFHPRAKPETILKQATDDKEAFIRRILEAATLPTIAQPDVDPRLATPRPVVWNTRAEVERMLEPIIARVPEFTATFQDNDTTVTFSCKGAVDSHSLSVPLRWLKQKAEIVARGRLALMALNEHFDKTSAGGKNAYTNVVIA